MANDRNGSKEKLFIHLVIRLTLTEVSYGPGIVLGAEKITANETSPCGSHILVVAILGRDIKKRQIHNMPNGNM